MLKQERVGHLRAHANLLMWATAQDNALLAAAIWLVHVRSDR